jgi:ABC-type sugar transport system ATPase subunit
VRANNIWQKARELSGGNQQKVVLAKWLATQPRILILDEPTRGIDVGTKAAVHALMSKLASEGMAILMISSELPEVLGMSDRILVMHEGQMTAQFTREQATQEKIIEAATQTVTAGGVA